MCLPVSNEQKRSNKYYLTRAETIVNLLFGYPDTKYFTDTLWIVELVF